MECKIYVYISVINQDLSASLYTWSHSPTSTHLSTSLNFLPFVNSAHLSNGSQIPKYWMREKNEQHNYVDTVTIEKIARIHLIISSTSWITGSLCMTNKLSVLKRKLATRTRVKQKKTQPKHVAARTWNLN